MSSDDAAWTAWAEKAAAEYNSKPKPGEEMASEPASQKAWQAQMDGITRQMKREHRAENLARRMLQERRLHAFTTDLLIGHLWNARQRSMTSDWESRAQLHYDTVTIKTLLKLCDHLGITDPGADESQQLAREYGPQIRTTFDKQAVRDALENEKSTTSTAIIRLGDAISFWWDGRYTEDQISVADALFALIDALPKSTTQQAGGAE